MAHRNKVVQSLNAPGEQLCVDVFCRPDGTYGFQEYRRDPEDGQGWYPMGFSGDQVFASQGAALQGARGSIAWLETL